MGNLEPSTKGTILHSLRLFLKTCPTTGGQITMSKETIESCCSSQEVAVISCEETGKRLFEHPVDAE
ncbi:hypothetical protein GCM10009037_29630 [Halarchaeum grantii]|uniref:DUF8054 domain-containing protein n=1 Tax=Halarchaeum grantii TaxID=1193105 RepID=A0A830FDG7_9EURY|nr:hypothetical protein GCM10009037_29630 [Halarchaeum grantii]